MDYNETTTMKGTIMPKFSFENLHANHKMAFLDGFLCGITVVAIGAVFYKDYLENKATREAIVEAEEAEARKMTDTK